MDIDLSVVEVVDLVRFADHCADAPGSWTCAGCGVSGHPRSVFAALVRDRATRTSERAIVVCRRCSTSLVRQLVVDP